VTKRFAILKKVQMAKNILVLFLSVMFLLPIVMCIHKNDIIIIGGKYPSIIKDGKHGSTIILGMGHKHDSHDDHNDHNDYNHHSGHNNFNHLDFGHFFGNYFGHIFDLGNHWWRR
jgi:hypothetical protein